MSSEKDEKREFGYAKMSDENIKKLAVDIHNEKVFTNIGLNEGDVRTSFQVINFFDKETFEFITNNPPGLIYEYKNKSINQLSNRLPIFSGVIFVSQKDAVKIFEKLNIMINMFDK